MNKQKVVNKVWLLLMLGLVFPCACQKSHLESNQVHILKTPTGVRFGILGTKKLKPAPTLFILSSTLETSLTHKYYKQCGTALAKQGYLCVSLDLPCHGLQKQKDEPNGLKGWRYRLDKGQTFVTEFTKELIEVLDYLIEQGYTHPEKVAACGTSRGGFLALHFAANEPRIKCVAAFAPVVSLDVLTEFKTAKSHPEVVKTALTSHADKLAGRNILIIIGDRDTRVDTDRVIKFAGKVSKLSGPKASLQLRVVPEPRGHTTPDGSAESAALWIIQKLEHFNIFCSYLGRCEDEAGKEDCTAILRYCEQI